MLLLTAPGWSVLPRSNRLPAPKASSYSGGPTPGPKSSGSRCCPTVSTRRPLSPRLGCRPLTPRLVVQGHGRARIWLPPPFLPQPSPGGLDGPHRADTGAHQTPARGRVDQHGQQRRLTTRESRNSTSAPTENWHDPLGLQCLREIPSCLNMHGWPWVTLARKDAVGSTGGGQQLRSPLCRMTCQ